MPLLSRWPISRCKLKKGATTPLTDSQPSRFKSNTQSVVLGGLRATRMLARHFTRCGAREYLLPPLPPRFLHRAQRDVLRNANAMQSLGAGYMGYITFPGFPHCDRSLPSESLACKTIVTADRETQLISELEKYNNYT